MAGIAAGSALALILAIALAFALSAPPPPIRDRPVPPASTLASNPAPNTVPNTGPNTVPNTVPNTGPNPGTDRPLRLVVLGTSLTALYDWPDLLAETLAATLPQQGCQPAGVTLVRIARPGATSVWGAAQATAVLQARPDLVVIEFAINDADLRDGLSLRDSAAMHRQLIGALRAGDPGLALVLMTTNPAQGLRGALRPWLRRYYALYPALAAEFGLGLADLYPRWLALPRAARGLDADGLHPDADVAGGVIVPVLAPLIADALAAGCAAAPISPPGVAPTAVAPIAPDP